jgi:hypothetical protein
MSVSWYVCGFALGHAGHRVSASVYFLGRCCYAKQPDALTEVATNSYDFCNPTRPPDERTLDGSCLLFTCRCLCHMPLVDLQGAPSYFSMGKSKGPMLSTAVDMTSFAIEALLLQSDRQQCFGS